MATTTTPLTIDDYEGLPQEVAEKYKLVDGELVEVSGSNLEHNDAQGCLFAEMRPFVSERHLGKVLFEQEFDFDGATHAPDISFFGVEKLPLVDRQKRVQRFVPDLAIEIGSHTDTFHSLLLTKDRYRRCGTREVWIVSLKTREVYVFADRGYQLFTEDSELSTPLIPGFQIPVRKLFDQD